MSCWGRWASIVEGRRKRGLLRECKNEGLIDFSSNDYLGLARNQSLTGLIDTKLGVQTTLTGLIDGVQTTSRRYGSTGSRLLSGNSDYAMELERFIADFHYAPDCLLFNSGFDANVGLFSTIASSNDAILYDEMIHASVHDGIRQSRTGYSGSFKHNDPTDLQQCIIKVRQRCKGTIFVAIETIYSMDGDIAPLQQFLEITRCFDGIEIIVDEAHATGVIGEKGRGLVNHLNLHDRIRIRVHTFGKALGCQGACILAPTTLKTFLLNYARPLIFSTFLPTSTLVAIHQTYIYIEKNWKELQDELFKRIEYFSTRVKNRLPSDSQIQGIIISGNENVVRVSNELAKLGLDVRPIRSPTVPQGQERLRICIHVHNTFEELDLLINSINHLSMTSKL